MRFVLGFLLGLVAGYCAVLFGWVAYTNLASSHHFEGAVAMQVAFFFAPAGGLLTGLALGIYWQTNKR
jgi:H+/Cl- antiporter ClcA